MRVFSPVLAVTSFAIDVFLYVLAGGSFVLALPFCVVVVDDLARISFLFQFAFDPGFLQDISNKVCGGITGEKSDNHFSPGHIEIGCESIKLFAEFLRHSNEHVSTHMAAMTFAKSVRNKSVVLFQNGSFRVGEGLS